MNVLKKINLPGVIWALLLVAIAWFLAANFPEEIWYPIVLVVITALVKALEVRLVDQLPEVSAKPEGEQMRSMNDVTAYLDDDDQNQHRIRRWLMG